MNGLHERLLDVQDHVDQIENRVTRIEAHSTATRWLLTALLIEQTAAIIGIVVALLLK